MVVHGCYLDAVLDQLAHHWVDLRFQQDKIAHDHCVTTHGFKCHPTAERQSGLNSDAVQRHVEVGAWKPIAMHITGDRRWAQGIIDLWPVNALRRLTAP